jgi:hypothetical protein
MSDDLKKIAREWNDNAFRTHPIELGSHDGIAVRLDWLGELVQERDQLRTELEAARERLALIDRRAGSASISSGFTDAHECAEWARSQVERIDAFLGNERGKS